MKKVFFCVLAFAMPFLVSAQMGFETYSPSYTSDDMVVLQGELDDIEDIDDGASIEIVISYRIEGAPSFTDFSSCYQSY